MPLTPFQANATALALAIHANVPTIIWDDPGSGKTSYLTALAHAYTLPIEVVIASLREPSDFAGLPVLGPHGVTMSPPAWARRLAEAKIGLLCLDEYSTAPPAVQAALLRVVQERWVGDLKLPDTVAIVAIANPPESSAGGWDLTPPAANRFVHIKWSVDVKAWSDGMRTGFKDFVIKPRIPENWTDFIPKTVSEVTSFLERAKPELLRQMPNNSDASGKAFPTPRTWDMGARLLAIAEASMSKNDLQEVGVRLLAGAVGEGAALEFLNWRSRLDLPDPEWLLENPDKFKVTNQDDKDFTVLQSVISIFQVKPTAKRWKAAWDIIASAVDQRKQDIAAVAADRLIRLKPENCKDLPESLVKLAPMLRRSGRHI